MSNTTQPKRRFSPIFSAQVTLNDSVLSGTTSKGVKFKKSAGATVVTPKGQTLTRTVMAFGEQLAQVEKSLRKGRTLTLAVQHDGGTLRIVGFPREKVAAEG